MKSAPTLLTKTVLCLALVFAPPFVRAQHLHFIAGASSPVQGAPLIVVNSNEFLAASGYASTLSPSTTGAYAGFYNANSPFIVAAATEAHAGPEPGAPALGSFIRIKMLSVEGPPGGVFSFWEANATSPTISLASGTTGTNSWALSESDGSPGSDPYGHIHGRRFGTTRPGFYKVAFQFADTSTNGTGGGPIHAPSEVFHVQFQAGVTILTLNRTNNVATVTFGTQSGRNYELQYATDLSPTNGWSVIAGSVAGNNRVQTLTDTGASPPARHYRVREF